MNLAVVNAGEKLDILFCGIGEFTRLVMQNALVAGNEYYQDQFWLKNHSTRLTIEIFNTTLD